MSGFSLEGALGPLSWTINGPEALALALLALAFPWLSWRSWRRLSDRHVMHRVLVLGCTALAFLAMGLLLLQPTLDQPAQADTTLLTEGGQLAQAPDGAFATPDAPALGERRITRLGTVAALPLQQPNLQSLEILGHGLHEEHWQAMPPGLSVRFDPPPLAGPVQLRWPRKLSLGDPLTVLGTLRLPAEDAVASITLTDPAGLVVAETSARSGQAFSLQTVPQGTGPLIYQLGVRRGDQQRAQEPVPVYVEQATRGRLLVMQSAPSFDTRQLANWAADEGQPLVILTQLSRDRNLTQRINVPEEAPGALDPALLAATDLALIDGRRWSELAEAERRLVLDAVTEGMGLMLYADAALASQLASEATPAGFQLTAQAVREESWPSWPGSAPEIPLTTAGWALQAPDASALTRSEDGELLEAWQASGAGRIAVSVLRERHRWLTSGDPGSFSRYWAHTLRTLGRPDDSPVWRPAEDMALQRIGAPARFCATGGARYVIRSLTALSPEQGGPSLSKPVPLVEHGWGMPLRCGIALPAQSGWQRLELQDGNGQLLDETFFYVFGPDDWKTAERHARQAASQHRSLAPGEAMLRTVRQPLSPWWAWGVLLFSLGVLWIERRAWELA